MPAALIDVQSVDHFDENGVAIPLARRASEDSQGLDDPASLPDELPYVVWVNRHLEDGGAALVFDLLHLDLVWMIQQPRSEVVDESTAHGEISSLSGSGTPGVSVSSAAAGSSPWSATEAAGVADTAAGVGRLVGAAGGASPVNSDHAPEIWSNRRTVSDGCAPRWSQ
jgi:hypothetical protein